MRPIQRLSLIPVIALVVSSFAFAAKDKFPEKFTVEYASTDSSGCNMLLDNNGVEYSVWSGSLFPRCVVFRPGETLNGRFRYGKSYIQLSYRDQKGKEKAQNYDVREATLLPAR